MLLISTLWTWSSANQRLFLGLAFLCSMQFAHRVKSVTLAEYKADEVEHMRQGGNQVCCCCCSCCCLQRLQLLLLHMVSRQWLYCRSKLPTMLDVLLQVAAYRYLARYTPDKDLRKPVDRYACVELYIQPWLLHAGAGGGAATYES
jgi:hypothetical protein